MTTALLRHPLPAEAEARTLQRELNELRRQLAAREIAIGDLRSSLLSFEGRYIRQVGILYKQLDDWHTKREALNTTPKAEDEAADDTLPPAADQPAADDLRQLFRELAKRIHPDFATDDQDALRRTRLMAQANEALLRYDRATLIRMLHGHDVSLSFTARESAAAALALLRRQLAHLREDLAAAEAEFHSLQTSDLAQLHSGVLTAAREGRDLLAEMAIRVQGLIGIAMRDYELDLDRIRRPNKGLRVEDVLSAETPEPRTPHFDSKRRLWRW